ncbi:probable acyl-[acyl-carrier-protein]--UDP-N-acetylglucosamine O-acyltransferase, mitochondrial isoform X2 [Oryza brachyantha]|uniref:probable acyl-[acyl-carrier-protein]--UDP-N-acetylglucosamine O-acyltransferase, mitochondrial isoform X2 n=1 Tax=Oryza brachyantha TaxID=4533 RepID=UPI000776799A|nr:probable acyl-[acyl-carrier-protein]--UDP-N-acetylglucosamine O-acyltransferase, mitochondrial isoform X2 [Oryza brachyantha]
MAAAAAATRAVRLLLSSSRRLHASASEGAATAREAHRSFIHTAAVVHPDAVIGQDVSIGPFCTVGASARIGDACQLHAGSHVMGDTELGERCVVSTGAILGADIPGKTIIGENNVIGHHAAIGVKCQDLKYKSGDECFLQIGNNNEIREYCSIHRSSKSCDRTVIGDNNLIMGSCHIAHDCSIGNNNIFANNTLFAGHVVVEDCTRTAGAVVVHQFCHIGSFSFLGGGAVVAQDVPRYMMVAGDRAELRGLNLEGLKRNGFSDQEEHETALSETPVSYMVESIRMSFGQGRRGICKFRNWNR